MGEATRRNVDSACGIVPELWYYPKAPDTAEAAQQGDLDMTGPLPIGADAPDFEAATTEGGIRFHEWLGNSWGVLFSHPKDFTPVCTTELGHMARIKSEFDKRHVKVIGLSVDPLDRHVGWSKDIAETQ